MSNQAELGVRTQVDQQPVRRRTAASGKQRRISINAAAFSHYFTTPLLGLGPFLVAVLAGAAMYFGWTHSDGEYIYITTDTYITSRPEGGHYGVGYWLGIAGSVMMLALLIYPLRKRLRALRVLGKVPAWFRAHMLLGVAGPTLILYHSTFSVKSLNGAFAMYSMLTIVASGIIGRYLFAKIHMGLYGTKAEIKEMLGDAELMKRALGGDYEGASRLLSELSRFEARVLVRHAGFLSSLWNFLTLGFRWQNLRSKLLREAKAAIAAEASQRGRGWTARRRQINLVREHLEIYFAAVNKTARLSVYERIFAFWHVLHMPLFFLLVVAVLGHIYAVHFF